VPADNRVLLPAYCFGRNMFCADMKSCLSGVKRGRKSPSPPPCPPSSLRLRTAAYPLTALRQAHCRQATAVQQSSVHRSVPRRAERSPTADPQELDGSRSATTSDGVISRGGGGVGLISSIPLATLTAPALQWCLTLHDKKRISANGCRLGNAEN